MKLSWTLALLTFAGGCGRTALPPVRFQVVDGETRLPLAGVKLQQENLQPMVFGSNKVEYVDYPPTGSDGLLLTRPLPRDYEIILSFSRGGYVNSSAGVGDDHVSIIAPVHAGPWVGRPDMIVPRVGLVTVPMYRIGSPPTTRDSVRRMDPLGEPATRPLDGLRVNAGRLNGQRRGTTWGQLKTIAMTEFSSQRSCAAPGESDAAGSMAIVVS